MVEDTFGPQCMYQVMMVLSKDTIAVLVLCSTSLVLGFASNLTSIICMLKMDKKISQVISATSIPVIGLISSTVFIPLLIVHTFHQDSFYLCTSIVIMNYIIIVVFMLSVLLDFIIGNLKIFHPEIFREMTEKSIFICHAVVVVILSLIVLAALIPNADSLYLVNVCLKHPIPRSSLRLSVYLGVGIFLTLILVAFQMLLDHLQEGKNKR